MVLAQFRRLRRLTMPLHQQRRFILAIPVTCLVTSLLAFGWIQLKTAEAEDGVQHTQQVRLKTKRLHTTLLEAETAVRGYDLTRQPEFLSNYEEAIADVPDSLQELRQLVEDSHSQSHRLRQIRTLAEARVELLEENLQLLRTEPDNRPDSQELTVLLLQGKQTMDRAREEIAQFLEVEERLQVERSERLQQQRQLTWLVLGLSAGIGIGGSMLTLYLLDRLERKLRDRDRHLRESEARYRALIENFPNGVVLLFDRQLRYLIADGLGLAAVGLSKNQLEGKTIWEALPPETCRRLEPLYRDALAGNATTQELVYADRTYLTHALPVRNDKGEVFAGMVVTQDITDRKQAEQQLSAVNRALKTLSECNQAVVRATDEPSLLAAICQKIVQFGGYHSAWVGFAENNAAKTVRPVAQAGYLEGYLDSIQITWSETESGRGPTGTAIRTGQTCIAQNLLTHPHYQPWREAARQRGYAASIALPLIVDRQPIGALNIDATAANAFNPEEVELLSELADDLAYGIAALRTEEALRSSEERWQLALRGNNDGIWDWNVQTNAVFFSPRWKEMLGFAPEEIADSLEEWAKRVHPDDLGWVTQAIQDHFDRKTPYYITEHRVQCKDGSYQWILDRGQALWDDEGNAIRMVGSHTDISDRKLAEASLRDSEAKFRAFVESASEAIIVTDEGGEIVVFNAKAETLFGYNRAEVFGRTVEFLIPQRYRQRHVAHRADYEVRPSQRSMGAARDLFAQRKDGSEFPIAAGLSTIETKDGRFVITFLSDITERKQAEAEIQRLNASLERRARESETRYRQIVELAEEGIWAIDSCARTTYVNRAIERMLGYSESELLGHPIADFLGDSPGQQASASVINPSNANQVSRGELKLKTKTGEECWVYMSTSPALDETGQMLWACALVYDITDRKQAEAQLRGSNERISLANAELARATRLKDEFLASMSHELRTPLNSILGLSEALQEEVYGELTPRQRKSLATIEQSGKHLLELINDILDLSKIESGKMALQISPVSLETLCQSSLTFIKQQAHQKQITLEFEISPELGEIAADERRLRQVLVNLLSNAVKFTPEGGRVILAVSANPEERVVQFSVKDTGIGIAPEHLDKLFQPFVQLDSRLSRRYAGTGLGLSLVRRIMELHGGGVVLESEVNQGSCFTVTLPWQPSGRELRQLQESGGKLQPLPPIDRALIIEDSEPAAKQIARYCQEIGARVTIQPQGEGAVAVALQYQPDIIVLDVLLPHLSGWEVLAQLKGNPVTQQIPVLVVSVVDERSQCVALGAADYLLKPISRQQFRAALQKVFATAPTSSPPLEARSPLILLAEDNEANIVTVSDYLQIQGYRLIVARNGTEAVQMALQQEPDLILMDIQMPEMDGLEATRRIRAEAKFATLPIIALTALAMPGDRDRCLAVGANEYLTKPVSLKELSHQIARYVPRTNV